MVRLGSFVEEREQERRKDEEDHRSLTDALGSLEEAVDESRGEDVDVEMVLRRLGDELTVGGREKWKVEEQMNLTRDALASQGRQGPETSQLERFEF